MNQTTFNTTLLLLSLNLFVASSYNLWAKINPGDGYVPDDGDFYIAFGTTDFGDPVYTDFDQIDITNTWNTDYYQTNLTNDVMDAWDVDLVKFGWFGPQRFTVDGMKAGQHYNNGNNWWETSNKYNGFDVSCSSYISSEYGCCVVFGKFTSGVNLTFSDPCNQLGGMPIRLPPATTESSDTATTTPPPPTTTTIATTIATTTEEQETTELSSMTTTPSSTSVSGARTSRVKSELTSTKSSSIEETEPGPIIDDLNTDSGNDDGVPVEAVLLIVGLMVIFFIGVMFYGWFWHKKKLDAEGVVRQKNKTSPLGPGSTDMATGATLSSNNNTMATSGETNEIQIISNTNNKPNITINTHPGIAIGMANNTHNNNNIAFPSAYNMIGSASTTPARNQLGMSFFNNNISGSYGSPSVGSASGAGAGGQMHMMQVPYNTGSVSGEAGMNDEQLQASRVNNGRLLSVASVTTEVSVSSIAAPNDIQSPTFYSGFVNLNNKSVKHNIGINNMQHPDVELAFGGDAGGQENWNNPGYININSVRPAAAAEVVNENPVNTLNVNGEGGNGNGNEHGKKDNNLDNVLMQMAIDKNDIDNQKNIDINNNNNSFVPPVPPPPSASQIALAKANAQAYSGNDHNDNDDNYNCNGLLVDEGVIENGADDNNHNNDNDNKGGFLGNMMSINAAADVVEDDLIAEMETDMGDK